MQVCKSRVCVMLCRVAVGIVVVYFFIYLFFSYLAKTLKTPLTKKQTKKHHLFIKVFSISVWFFFFFYLSCNSKKYLSRNELRMGDLKVLRHVPPCSELIITFSIFFSILITIIITMTQDTSNFWLGKQQNFFFLSFVLLFNAAAGCRFDVFMWAEK